jgi:hypothetical protein
VPTVKIAYDLAACLLRTRRAINWMLLPISSATREGSLIDKWDGTQGFAGSSSVFVPRN